MASAKLSRLGPFAADRQHASLQIEIARPQLCPGGRISRAKFFEKRDELRAQMRRLGLANMDQLQGWFISRVADHLIKHGRTPVGWDDELVAGAKLPDNWMRYSCDPMSPPGRESNRSR